MCICMNKRDLCIEVFIYVFIYCSIVYIKTIFIVWGHSLVSSYICICTIGFMKRPILTPSQSPGCPSGSVPHAGVEMSGPVAVATCLVHRHCGNDPQLRSWATAWNIRSSLSKGFCSLLFVS